MSEDTNNKPPHTVPRVCSTTPTTTDPVSLCLPPRDIERICKAFIRLITAKETRRNGK